MIYKEENIVPEDLAFYQFEREFIHPKVKKFLSEDEVRTMLAAIFPRKTPNVYFSKIDEVVAHAVSAGCNWYAGAYYDTSNNTFWFGHTTTDAVCHESAHIMALNQGARFDEKGGSHGLTFAKNYFSLLEIFTDLDEQDLMEKLTSNYPWTGYECKAKTERVFSTRELHGHAKRNIEIER